jgi:hypothetical protein
MVESKIDWTLYPLPRFVPAVFIKNVWGPDSSHNNDFYGGPHCAAQSTHTKRLLVNLLLVSGFAELTWLV